MRTKVFKKVMICIIAVMMLVVGGTPIVTQKTYAATTAALSTLPVGTKIMFAGQQFAVVTPSTGLVVSLKNVCIDKFDDNNTQKFDPNDSNNIGYYLNNGYYDSLSEKALIKNSTWDLKRFDDSTLYTNPTAYIGLLTATEYNAVTAAVFPSGGESASWWLITPYNSSVNENLIVHVAGTLASAYANYEYGVRPAFRIIETTIFTQDPLSGMYYYGGTGASNSISELAIGNTIMFHGEAWRVVNPSTGKLVTDRITGRRAFDPDITQVFDPTGSIYGTNNIGYYLNNTYYNNTTFTVAERSIIKNSTWDLTRNDGSTPYTNPTAKIGLLTETEYNIMKGSVFPSGGESVDWCLITPSGSNPAFSLYVNGADGNVANNVSNFLYGMRPALCILESISVVSVGNGVYMIDATSPIPPTLTPDITTPTNGNIIVTISNWGNATIKEYKIAEGLWTAYTVPLVITENETIYAKGTNFLGNESVTSSLSIENIDRTEPITPILTPDTSSPTTEDVIVTISNWGDAANKEYKIDAGAWTPYTIPVIMTTNGTMYARGTDTAGNSSTVANCVVSNIDYTGPTITPTPTSRAKSTSDIIVDLIINVPSGSLTSWGYQWGTEITPTGAWITETINTQTLNQTVTKSTDGIWYLHVKATDDSANTTTKYYGPYKKGVVLANDGYDAGDVGDRKSFKYYIGLDKNGIMRVMLVAGNINDDVMIIFNKSNILDESGKYKDGIFYIDREAKIKKYIAN
ncbi:MAG TPA: hypothetical protein DEP72_07665 [Clostridiales bacterium]|nr:MAG: hypothetical protein A2Y18_06965 [Clostridiales bacterium GWD2_32_19]HCC08013.1 hypothetical protein [Clostridiales bacterium]